MELPELIEKRDICSVLQDMRTMHKTRNYAAFMAAVEECQMYANKMEAALGRTRHTAAAVRKLLKENKLDEAIAELDKRYTFSKYELKAHTSDE
jgi:predicted transcriptional regulator